MCPQAGNLERAEHWFMKMLEAEIAPDENTYNSVINAAAKAGNLERAEHSFMETLKAEVVSEEKTYSSLINAAATGRQPRES